MATIIGPQQSDFWESHPMEAFRRVPPHLGCWMSRNHFNIILQVLSFTDLDPSTMWISFGGMTNVEGMGV